jgi:DNA repair protein RecO (recombination protein O)
MYVTTHAIVISSVKYNEADLIVKCFTEGYGVKSYLLRGILKSKKGLLKPALFQPFSILEMTVVHRSKADLHSIKEVKLAHPLIQIQTEIPKLSIVLFLSEVIKQCVQEEEENRALYHFLEDAIIWLENQTAVADFHLLFLIKLTHYLGFYPDVSSRHKPFFNPVEGVFEDRETNLYSVAVEQVSPIKELLTADFDSLKSLGITKTQRQSCLELLILYYQLHIQGFKTPKSLSVLKELFK